MLSSLRFTFAAPHRTASNPNHKPQTTNHKPTQEKNRASKLVDSIFPYLFRTYPVPRTSVSYLSCSPFRQTDARLRSQQHPPYHIPSTGRRPHQIAKCRGNSPRVCQAPPQLPRPLSSMPGFGHDGPLLRRIFVSVLESANTSHPLELKETHLGPLTSTFSRSPSTSTITDKDSKSQGDISGAVTPTNENTIGAFLL